MTTSFRAGARAPEIPRVEIRSGRPTFRAEARAGQVAASPRSRTAWIILTAAFLKMARAVVDFISTDFLPD